MILLETQCSDSQSFLQHLLQFVGCGLRMWQHGCVNNLLCWKPGPELGLFEIFFWGGKHLQILSYTCGFVRVYTFQNVMLKSVKSY